MCLETTVTCPKFLIFIVLFAAALGCADGSLEILSNEAQGNGTNNPGNGSDDAGTDANSSLNSECCTPDTLECVSSDEYRVCEFTGETCGTWVGPLPCSENFTCNFDSPEGQHPCEPSGCSETHPDYGSECDADLEDCQVSGTYTCDGPDLFCDPGDNQCTCANGYDDGLFNYDINNAHDLNVGDVIEDLILCDVGLGQAWFSLGQTTTIDVHLQWPNHPEALELIIRTGSIGAVHESAGTGIDEIFYQETLSASEEVWVTVEFNREYVREEGVPYTISRPN